MKPIKCFSALLMIISLSLVLCAPDAFADDSNGYVFFESQAKAENPTYPAQKVANHFTELAGLLKKMNQNIERLSTRVGQARPAVLAAPVQSQPSAKRGMAIFHEMQCISCHGVNGKGHEAKTNMKDERGLPIMAADLTQPSSFGNGNSRKDIFRTIMTGLDGSPMPSFVDLFVGEEHRAWDLVEYVYSLQEDALARFLP